MRPHDSTFTNSKRRKVMKMIKALMLLAVVMFGIAAVSTGARQLDCPDPDCCAHCNGC